ncbi:MAG: twin-arginine translocase subunit TatC [Phycisphaeraceae bacterium]|nr:twin-arginine translocase subunit TatC [Phycisphaeraceae bacterium]MCW5753966.1 twin-arginine translocase subunit TatC [Phycisphaeraceae bacterium]
MTFGEHLEDLRRHIMLALVGLVPLFVLALIFGKPLLAFLITPVLEALRNADLPPVMQATSPVETFGAYVRVAFIITLVIGAPWATYQLWRFVAPGLYVHEKRVARILIPMSGVLGAVGVAFLYFVILPVVLAFFIHFGTGVVKIQTPTAPLPAGITLGHIPVLDADPEQPEVGDAWINRERRELRFCVEHQNGRPHILSTELGAGAGVIQQYRISEYVKLFFSMAVAFALGFQTPVVVLLLGWAGLVTPQYLARYRKHAILLIVVMCALLTPPDPLSLVLLSGPLYMLYEGGCLILKLFPPKREEDGEPTDDQADEPPPDHREVQDKP